MLAFVFSLLALASPASAQPRQYAMYVWREGWDPQGAGCDDLNRFLDWDLGDSCFTHTWDTPERRQWLWDTCKVPGREVSQLFFYDTEYLEQRQCVGDPQVDYLRETLREGRQQVPGLQFYALYSDGGVGIPEQDRVSHVVWYNTQCAQSDDEKFDGVAVNNENYDRYWSEAQMVAYLDNMYRIREEADKQDPPGSLKTHYSVSYNWGKDDSQEDIYVTWRDVRQPIMRHFIDIFHSLDVQVAYILADVMRDRLFGAEWDYAQQGCKELLPTIYLSKTLPCEITFFPFPDSDPDCASWSHANKSEAVLFQELDQLEVLVPGIRPVLHHFRGPYSSGGHPDWPRH